MFNIANYYTNVDLAQGLTINLIETELALRLNPDTLSCLILFDQAHGAGERVGQEIDGPYRIAAFPTDWDGVNNYDSGGFGQDIWTDTGISLIEASNLNEANARALLEASKAYSKEKYSDVLQYLVNKTGSTLQQYDPDLSLYFREEIETIEDGTFPIDINLGITTEFRRLGEMQTGSPLSVDYLLEQSRSSDYFGQNPHALFLSNHGGSIMGGSNHDDDTYDNDIQGATLQVKDFAKSLKNALDASSKDERLGLVAYDECLMANVELVTELSTSTRYVLASQETIPGNGYDYLLTLSDFTATSPIDSQESIEDTAKSLGNAFIESYNERNPDTITPNRSTINTLSLSDTSTVATLNAAIKDYVEALTNSSDDFIASLLNSIRQKGTNYAIEYLQDLGNLALISRSSVGASEELIASSNAILGALGKTVVNNNQKYNPLEGFRLNASSGLTITLPTSISKDFEAFISTFKLNAPAFEAETGWSKVLERIAPIITGGAITSRSETSKAFTITSGISQQTGEQALVALKLEGFLSHTSNDQKINQTKITLPDLEAASIADLDFYFNALNLNKTGSISINVADKSGKAKASWQETIKDAKPFSFIGADLSESVKSLVIESGDTLTISPDKSIEVRYDFHLTINDHTLESYQDWTSGEIGYVSRPLLLNTKADDAIKNTFKYETPVAPRGEDFTTKIVLISGTEGVASLTVRDIVSDSSVTFSSDSYIDEYIRLLGGKQYEITFGYDSNGTFSENPASDISLLVDHMASEAFLLRDSILTSSIELDTWGKYSINKTLTSEVLITEVVTDSVITSLDDLSEGQNVDAEVSTLSISGSSVLREATTGGTQTFNSGIWSSEVDYTLNTSLEGISDNEARFGFFEVDTLTGEINTELGLIAASNSDAYRAAALANLIAPLVDLKQRDKSGTFVADIKAASDYAAILLTKDQSGRETALFSIAGANPNQNAQLLNYGKGYFGWEDLVKGRDDGYDGDFNDLTFTTT